MPVSNDSSAPVEEPPKSSTKQESPGTESPDASGASLKEGAWKEDYEDVIEPSEEEAQAAETATKEKPKKTHWVGIMTVIVIIVLLLLWTLLSPKVMSTQGTTYLDSPRYANLGNFTGTRNIWTGDVSWGVSVSGTNNTTAETSINIEVLITKVSERPSNFFFRGLGISVTNCTLWDLNGTYIAKFSTVQDLGFGKMATITTKFPAGEHDLYVSVKFTEYEVMRLGFIPLESVQVEKVYLSTIHIES